MPPSEGPDNPVDGRLRLLEESVAFAQHENEQMATEVLALGTRVVELMRRIELLERQLQVARTHAIAEGKPNEDAGKTRANGEGVVDGAER